MTTGALWDWAVEAYERPGAAAALLRLQDEAGQNAPLLLWAAWARPDAAAAGRGARQARAWETSAVAPLRRLRRDLKAPPAGIDAAAAESLRRQVKDCELAAERLLLQALEGLGSPGTEDLGQALAHAARAWGGEEAPDLTALIAALSPAS